MIVLHTYDNCQTPEHGYVKNWQERAQQELSATDGGTANGCSHFWLFLIKPHNTWSSYLSGALLFTTMRWNIQINKRKHRRKHERHKWKDVTNVTGVLKGKQGGILEIIFEDTRSELSKNEKKKGPKSGSANNPSQDKHKENYT